MDPLLFYGLLVVFLVVIELGRPAISASQANAGVEAMPRRRRLAIDALWYVPLLAVVVADLVGSELAADVVDVYFVIAAAGAALSVLVTLEWLWKKARDRAS